jgi:hypothetical protein
MPPAKVLIFFSETEQTHYVLVHGDQGVNSIGDFELYVTQDDSFDDPNNIPISDFEVWARLVPMDTHGYTVIDFLLLHTILCHFW